MAIQAQVYPDSNGFPVFIAPEWAGGGGGGVAWLHNEMWLNGQRQQFQSMNPFLETKVGDETPSSSFLGSQIEKQSLDIDQFILLQNERLRLVLREQRKRDVAELLTKIETRASFLINQKDEEIAKATLHTSQLESLLVKLQSESLTWQQIARQNEVHVISLSNAIQQLQQQSAALHDREPAVEDTESCCDEQEQQSGLNGVNGFGKMVCRVCGIRVSGVVILPCRHLCLCTVCDPMIDFCPVCQTEKKASIEALFR